MLRVAFELIWPEADKLFMKMCEAKNIVDIKYYWDAYVELLKNAGWDPMSFDKEIERRVDADWDNDHNGDLN